MASYKKSVLLKSYLHELLKMKGRADHQLGSFNYYVKEGLQKTLYDIERITISLPTEEVITLKFGRVFLDKPQIREADGSVRYIFPSEARLRNLTYRSPIIVEITPIYEDIEKQPEKVIIGHLPVMVKSDLCVLSKMSDEELIEAGEDPDDPGGYFIINGTERVMILAEDLASGKITYFEDNGVIVARLNSEKGGFIQRHQFERRENGVIVTRFSNVVEDPVNVVDVIRALGIKTDKDIISLISPDEGEVEDVLINLYSSGRTYEESLENLGKKLRIKTKEELEERVLHVLDNYLLSYLGNDPRSRMKKAYLLAVIMKNMIKLYYGKIEKEDIDHYGNKRVKLSGELIDQLIRSVIIGKWGLVSRLQYSYQKIMKRGRKISRLQSIISPDVLDNMLMRAMATGNWVGNRTGVSQRLERTNFIRTMAHLRSIVSPLASTQEHFEARELHPTKFGRVCAVRTPEGQNIGLRNYCAVGAEISTLPTAKVISKAMEDIKNIMSKYATENERNKIFI